jgi:hypothetical protein
MSTPALSRLQKPRCGTRMCRDQSSVTTSIDALEPKSSQTAKHNHAPVAGGTMLRLKVHLHELSEVSRCPNAAGHTSAKE